MLRRQFNCTALVLASLLASAGPSVARPHDSSFGGDGTVVVGFGPQAPPAIAQAATVTGRGAVIAVGILSARPREGSRFAVAWLKPDGSPKQRFGGDGRVVSGFGSRDAEPQVAVRWRRGKVVVGGRADGEFALARYTRRGALDRTFGGNGKVVARLGGNPRMFRQGIYDMMRTPNRTLTVAGLVWSRPVVARFRAGGSLDTSFGQNGVVRVSERFAGYPRSVHLNRDGTFVAVGRNRTSEGMVTKYTAAGDPDPTFGVDGTVALPNHDYDVVWFNTAFELPDGGQLLGGGATPGSDYSSYALALVDAAGVPDASFGDAGIAIHEVSDLNGSINDVTMLGDRRAVVIGYSQDDDGPMRLTIARYTPQGTLDESFSGDGLLYTHFRNRTYGAIGMGLAVARERIIAVGGAGGRFGLVALRLPE